MLLEQGSQGCRIAEDGAHTPMNDLPRQAEFPPDQPPRFTSGPSPSATAHLIGERVRTARFAAHMTQQELAGATYSKSYISAVERGKMTPSFQALSLLAARLGRPISYFLGEEVSEAPIEAPADDSVQAALLNEAERVFQEGRYEEALALFSQAGKPERANQARERYAQSLADQGCYQEAYEQLRRVLGF
jgi:transcriptional regulator with XRE-family HTH domain